VAEYNLLDYILPIKHMNKENKIKVIKAQIDQFKFLQSQGAPYPRVQGTPAGETYESKIAKLEKELFNLIAN
jgi:hypothetical protein